MLFFEDAVVLLSSLGPVYEFVCISFRTDLDIISTVLGQVDHGGQDGNSARTRIRDETFETNHTQKRCFRHGAICRTIKALAILRCLYGSEMVQLGVVIKKCETPTTNISQENGPGILMITCPTRDKQQWTYFSFFPKSF